jgi:hypothetical protein
MNKRAISRQTVERGEEIFVALRCINSGASGVDWGDGWVSVSAEHEELLTTAIRFIDDPYAEYADRK